MTLVIGEGAHRLARGQPRRRRPRRARLARAARAGAGRRDGRRRAQRPLSARRSRAAGATRTPALAAFVPASFTNHGRLSLQFSPPERSVALTLNVGVRANRVVLWRDSIGAEIGGGSKRRFLHPGVEAAGGVQRSLAGGGSRAGGAPQVEVVHLAPRVAEHRDSVRAMSQAGGAGARGRRGDVEALARRGGRRAGADRGALGARRQRAAGRRRRRRRGRGARPLGVRPRARRGCAARRRHVAQRAQVDAAPDALGRVRVRHVNAYVVGDRNGILGLYGAILYIVRSFVFLSMNTGTGSAIRVSRVFGGAGPAGPGPR